MTTQEALDLLAKIHGLELDRFNLVSEDDAL